LAHACIEAGHEVLVAAQSQHRANVERARLPFAPVSDPPRDEWMPLMGSLAELDLDMANALMIGEFFGNIDTRAALPGLLRIVETWQPDVVVRESWEFASTIAADLLGIPLARVGLGLASVEAFSVELAAAPVDAARVRAGLPPDPSGERLTAAPYLTQMPELVEAAAAPGPTVQRLRTTSPRAIAPLPDWWPGNDDPLVYVTFGSVTADAHLPYFPALYRAALDALAPLPARVLVTIGNSSDPGRLGPVPGNCHVERWIPQDAVLPHAAAIVCHGGYGSTLGALAHGVPLVVVPLFSIDQWANADAIARVGAGVALTGERQTRRVLDLPGPATLAELAPAVSRVLADSAYRSAAALVADAVRALPPVDTAVDLLAAVSRGDAPPPCGQSASAA
jgi:UDP:flavonoid glycosyltransferase YjiC (YdhE family)